jgi:hypothetical protein
VVQGWPGLYFLTRTPFQDILPLYSNTSFPTILASYWCQECKRFYTDCVVCWWHWVWVHQGEICPPRCTIIGPTNEDHWGLSQGFDHVEERKSLWIVPSESHNTLATILLSDGCLEFFWVVEIAHDTMLDCFASEAKHLIAGHYRICGCFPPVQTGTDVWQTAHLISWVESWYLWDPTWYILSGKLNVHG